MGYGLEKAACSGFRRRNSRFHTVRSTGPNRCPDSPFNRVPVSPNCVAYGVVVCREPLSERWPCCRQRVSKISSGNLAGCLLTFSSLAESLQVGLSINAGLGGTHTSDQDPFPGFDGPKLFKLLCGFQ